MTWKKGGIHNYYISQKLKMEKVKVEIEQVNKLLPNIRRDNILGRTDLIFAGAKLHGDKIDVSGRNLNKNTKPWSEIWLEGQVKKTQQQAKVLRKEKHKKG